MSAETANDAYGAHSLSLSDRKHLKLTGITDVRSFDEQNVTLDSSFGEIEIGGEDLHVEVLDLKGGIIELTGRIDSIVYSESEKPDKTRKGFWERLFR